MSGAQKRCELLSRQLYIDRRSFTRISGWKDATTQQDRKESKTQDLTLHKTTRMRNKMTFSCTPDREILHFTPCEKFLSHPRYLTPVASCVQMFFFNTDCIGRHVISLLSAHVTMTSKRFKSKWRSPRFYHFSR